MADRFSIAKITILQLTQTEANACLREFVAQP